MSRMEGSPLPSVSVIVPTFRRPLALRRCLEALAQLQYPRDRLEIVIVDDGGGAVSHHGLAVLPPDLQVRLVVQKNRGPASARNRGAREATGDILAFTDDDCCPRPEWLLDLTAGLADEPCALVGGPIVNALLSNIYAQASQDLVSFLYEYFPDGRALLPFFTSNNIACRRSPFLEVGGFDETFRFSAGEDRDLSERWAAAVGRLHHLPGAVVDHYHELTFGRFLRQHHYYGRGAIHLARRREKRGWGRPRPEPLVFYARMLAYPIRHHGWLRGGLMAGLLSLAQLSGLSGMLAEALHPSHRDEAHGC